MEKLNYKTCIFKLHSLNSAKRAKLDGVFTAYTVAMNELLMLAQTKIDDIMANAMDAKGKYTASTLAPFLPKSAEVESAMSSALKEALLANVSAMLASYCELKKADDRTGYPVARDPDPQAWPDALTEFGRVGNDLELENLARDKMMTVAKGSFMPINYSRSRDFNILWDSEADRFFLFLKLFGEKQGEAVVINQGNLIDVNTNEPFKRKTTTGLLLPLEMGRRNEAWHWQYQQFIEPTMAGEAHIKAGKLIKEDDGYFLHVSFGFPEPEPIEAQTILGVDSGVFFTSAYALIDLTGRVLEKHHEADGFRDDRIKAGRRVQSKQQRGKEVTMRDYRKKYHDFILHNLANNLIDLALTHESMIVLEELNIQTRGAFYRSAWKKFHGMIGYKAKMSGIKVKTVWAAFTSKMCIKCGEMANRDDRSIRCPHCGHNDHADEAAAVNIARRGLYAKADWGGTKTQAGDWKAFHKSFANLATF